MAHVPGVGDPARDPRDVMVARERERQERVGVARVERHRALGGGEGGRDVVGVDERVRLEAGGGGVGRIEAGGVKALRRGLVLLEDAARATNLIAEHLDPTDP